MKVYVAVPVEDFSGFSEPNAVFSSLDDLIEWLGIEYNAQQTKENMWLLTTPYHDPMWYAVKVQFHKGAFDV